MDLFDLDCRLRDLIDCVGGFGAAGCMQLPISDKGPVFIGPATSDTPSDTHQRPDAHRCVISSTAGRPDCQRLETQRRALLPSPGPGDACCAHPGCSSLLALQCAYRGVRWLQFARQLRQSPHAEHHHRGISGPGGAEVLHQVRVPTHATVVDGIRPPFRQLRNHRTEGGLI